MSGFSDDEAERFGRAFQGFMEWVHATQHADSSRNEVVRVIRDFLGPDGSAESVVSRQLPVFEHVNLQTALNNWTTRPGRTVETRGISIPPHFGTISLQQLLGGDGLPPLRLSAPGLIDLPDGPGSSLACILRAALLVADDRGQYVLLVSGPAEHEPTLTLEVAGLAVEAAQSVLAELDDLRHTLNVYRGHLLDIAVNDRGGIALHFAPPPETERDDVILPDAVLERIERHAVGISAHRDALRAAGQHLKRGLLLYGPPGTGKTHTTRYLMGRLAGYTRLVLTGRALHAIGSVAELARDLQPAAVVLEDVDLVAEDRSFGPGGSPVLFDLLDAMDGAAPDADLLFLLTTNRADLLEPALAARPGRVDVAVAVQLPDHIARLRLLELYSRGVPVRLDDAERGEIAERTAGVTASFLKELMRRAVLESLQEGAERPADDAVREVTAAHFARALDDLMDSAQGVTRTLLGVGPGEDGAGSGEDGTGSGEDGAGGAGPVASPAPMPRPAAFGWTSYTPMSSRVRHFRRGGWTAY